jgi:monoterpene epsilon-lactone hydrolase
MSGPPDREEAQMRPIEQVRAMLKGLIGGPDTPFMERRAQTEAFAAAFEIPAGITVKRGGLAGVPVEWVRPRNAVAPYLFLHLHGGGYVLGNPAASRPFTTALAHALRAPVVSVDYKLAPEHPFPAAVEDALAAWRGLLSAGHDPKTIAVGGESAGGGLAIALMVAARDAGLALPAAIVAMSPWADMRCNAKSLDTKAGTDPMLTRRSLREMADAYLSGSLANSPLASPVLADLRQLPPLLIQVGSEEVLLDDARALHHKAFADGVDAHIEIWPEMIHVFQMFHPMLEEGGQAIRRIAEFVTTAWNAVKREEADERQRP